MMLDGLAATKQLAEWLAFPPSPHPFTSTSMARNAYERGICTCAISLIFRLRLSGLVRTIPDNLRQPQNSGFSLGSNGRSLFLYHDRLTWSQPLLSNLSSDGFWNSTF